MGVIQLDVKKFESGLGFGTAEIVAGAPFASVVTRVDTMSAGKVLGNSDGYDLSNGTALRVYYDILLGSATYVDLLIRPIAANLERSGGRENVPVAVASIAQSGFDPKILVLGDAAGPITVAPAKIRFEASERGCFTITRNSALFQFKGESDHDDGAIALAVQSILDPGGEC